jgi:hypothetical protein
VDCSSVKSFCKTKLSNANLPSFATVLNGSVDVVTDPAVLQSAKALHDDTTNKLLNIDGLVVSVNSDQHIQSRLLSVSSATAGQPTIAIILFTDKYVTSPLYASLAYRHRHAGFSAFGESRGSNVNLAKKYGINTYPTLVALTDGGKVERYNGQSLDLESLSKWLDELAKKYLRSQPKTDNKEKQRAR